MCAGRSSWIHCPVREDGISTHIHRIIIQLLPLKWFGKNETWMNCHWKVKLRWQHFRLTVTSWVLYLQGSATPWMGVSKAPSGVMHGRESETDISIPLNIICDEVMLMSKTYSHFTGITYESRHLSIDPRSDQWITDFLYGPNSDSFTMRLQFYPRMR